MVILNNSVLQFGKGPFLFQLDNTPMQSEVQTNISVEFGVRTLDLPLQIPDLNTIKPIWETNTIQARY